MSPEELVLTILDMNARHAPQATILAVAARALKDERERCARAIAGYQDIVDEARMTAGYANSFDLAAVIRALP